MFGGYSAREILLWIGGTLVVAVFVMFGVILVVDTYLDFRDPSDMLQRQGGLGQEQETSEKK
jgi:hypothetical protein